MKVKLGDVCDKASSNIRQKDIIDESGNYPIYGAAGKLGLVDFYQQNNSYIGVVKDGAGIGRTILLPPKSSVIGTMQYLIPKENVLPEYLYYVVKHMHLEKFQTGATIPHIYFKDYKNVTFDLVPIERQKQIVEQFSKIERILQVREQQLSNLDTLVKARFVEMFGDPIENCMNFPVYKLEDLCDKLTDGTHSSPESFESGDYKYITAKNIKVGGFDFSNLTYVTKPVHDSIYSRCNPELGDVLYIKDGVTTGVAMVNSLNEQFSMLSSVALLKQNREKIDGVYLCGVLNNEHKYDSIRRNMGGAAITRLTIRKLKNIEVPVAPMEKQREYADFVQQVDKSKVAIQKSLDETQLLFDSLMQEYFS